jgi:hypothetical protein
MIEPIAIAAAKQNKITIQAPIILNNTVSIIHLRRFLHLRH